MNRALPYLRSHKAMEQAAEFLRAGRTPPKDQADRLATALEAAAYAIRLAETPDWPFEHIEQQEARSA